MPDLGPPPPDAGTFEGKLDFLLVTKKPEASFLAAALTRCDSSAGIARAGSLEEIDAALGKCGPNARLIGFSTSLVVPQYALKAFGGNAYNFHPGPPEYPGNRPSAFACYESAKLFGVTLHHMSARVDEGDIIDCTRFVVGQRSTAGQLALAAYQALARLFLRNAIALARRDRPLPANGERWHGRKTTLAMFDAMRAVPGDIDADELDRRIRAFNWIYTPWVPPVGELRVETGVPA